MSKTNFVNDRICLIPLKGILAELKPIIVEKFNGGEFKYVTGDFRLPSDKMLFEMEVIVDDNCGVCPYAVEFASEVAAKHKNVVVKVYNVSYVKPPFEPIVATPTFRINRKVKFAGMPLDPVEISKYFSVFFREAYILGHPKFNWLIERIRAYAEANGYMRNPNDTAFMGIVYRLLKNIDDYGYPFCPCRPLKKVAGATQEQIYSMNKDKICPCIYAKAEIEARGCCLCGLFWSKSKVDEYIKDRVRTYGHVLREIEQVQKALEELKRRVITGRSRRLAEAIINKLQDIYVSLPD